MPKLFPFALVLTLFLTGASARAQDSGGGDVTVTDLSKPQSGGDVRVTDLSATSSAVTPHDSSATYLTPGFLLALAGGPTDATGIGGEISLMRYGSGTMPGYGLGGVAQLQIYDGKWLRGALAGQGTYGPVGVEIGLGLRQGDALDATTLSFQATEFLSLGYVSIGVRESPALVAFPSNLPSFGFETALTLAFKVPIAIAGTDRTHLVPDITGAGAR